MPLLSENFFQPGLVVLSTENSQSNSPFSPELLFFRVSGCFQTGFKLCRRFSRSLLISTANHHDLDFTLLLFYLLKLVSIFLEPLSIPGKMRADNVDFRRG